MTRIAVAIVTAAALLVASDAAQAGSALSPQQAAVALTQNRSARRGGPVPTAPSGSPQVWLDGSDINLAGNSGMSDTDPVGTWKNKGSLGAAVDFTQATAGKKPLYKVNIVGGKSCVIGDGTDDWMSSAGTIASAAKTIFVVAKANATAGSKYIFAIKSTVPSNNWGDMFHVGATYRFAGQLGTVASSYQTIPDALNTSPHIWAMTYNGSGSGTAANYTFALDGTSKTVSTPGATDFFVAADPSMLYAYVSGGVGFAFFSGYICEAVAYEGVVSAADFDGTTNYLRAKYGL